MYDKITNCTSEFRRTGMKMTQPAMIVAISMSKKNNLYFPAA